MAKICDTKGKLIYGSNAKDMRGAVVEAVGADVDLSRADLSFVNLSGIDFNGSNMEGVVLDWAILSDSNLSRCNLKGASFKQAYLNRARFKHANLYRAVFSNAVLCDAYLGYANLEGVDLGGANLEGADLTYANLYSTCAPEIDDESFPSHSLYDLGKTKTTIAHNIESWWGGPTWDSVVVVDKFTVYGGPKMRHVPRGFADRPKGTDDVLADRAKRYGSFGGHAAISQALQKVVYKGFAKREDGKTAQDMTDAQREALFMIMHKVARIVNGDFNYDDSWRDIAGYATLVANELGSKND